MNFPPLDTDGKPITLGCCVQYVTGMHPRLKLECMQVKEIILNGHNWVLNGLHLDGSSCTLVGVDHVKVAPFVLPPVEDQLLIAEYLSAKPN